MPLFHTMIGCVPQDSCFNCLSHHPGIPLGVSAHGTVLSEMGSYGAQCLDRASEQTERHIWPRCTISHGHLVHLFSSIHSTKMV